MLQPIPEPPAFPPLPFTLERIVLDAEERSEVSRVEIPGSGDYLLKGTKVAVYGPKPLRSPWTIIVRYTRSGWRAGISGDSDVYDGVSWSKITVSGLLSNVENENDAGWNGVRTGFVYLKGTVDADLNVTRIDVEWGKTSLGDIQRVEASGGKQKSFAFVLGYLWSEGSGDNIQWYVRQEAWRHITLMYVVVNGVLCKVPFEM